MTRRQDRLAIDAQDARERTLLEQLFGPRAWLVNVSLGLVSALAPAIVVALLRS